MHRFIIQKSLLKNFLTEKRTVKPVRDPILTVRYVILPGYSLGIEFLCEERGRNQHSSCRVSLLTIQQFYFVNIISYEFVFVNTSAL